MSQNMQIKGMWCLPDYSDDRIAGILSFESKSEIKLELLGSFIRNINDLGEIMEGNYLYDIIWGETFDGKEVTLLQCQSYISYNFSATYILQNFVVQFALIGCIIDRKDQNYFNQVTVNIPNLTSWINYYPIIETLSFADNNLNGYELNYVKTKSEHYLINKKDKSQLSFEVNCPPPNMHYEEVILKQKYLINIKVTDNHSFLSLYDLIERIRIFISLASMQDNSFGEITLYSPNNFQELDNGKRIDLPISFLHKQYLPLEVNKRSKELLFTYGMIKDEFKDIILKWYSHDIKMSPILRHLVKSIRSKNIFESGDFLIVVQALEGFSTRFRAIKKDENLKESLQKIFQEFNYISNINKLNIDFKVVVNTRHYYSHLFEKKANAQYADGQDLFDLTKKLQLVLICCILKETGFTPSTIEKIINQYTSRIY